jgi:mRNA interferase MazF
MAQAYRGEIWMADLDPSRGHEQAGRRPVLIVSNDVFNASAAGLVVVLPITSKAKPLRSHLPIEPGPTGLRTKSFVICDQPRTVYTDRLEKRLGAAPMDVLSRAEKALRVLLDL